MARTALVLALVAASAKAITDNFVDGQCATNDGADHFPYKSEAGAQFADVISADYSLLWEVQYEDDYKIVKNTKTGDVHILHQCGLDPPSNEDLPAYAKDGTMVEVPLTKIATTSTTYLAFLEMLGERKALKSYQSSFQYVSSPCLRKMHRDGMIEEKDAWADPPKLPDLEALGVQATFASSWGMDEHNAVLLTDTAEQQPNAVLKTAEYVEYVGLYFNREKEAAAAIEHIVANWLCTKEAVAGVVQDKAPVKVLWAQYWGSATCGDGSSGGWSVASGNTWYSEIIEAAGGSLIVPGVEAACESWGAPYLSTEQLLEVGADADVFISPGPWAADQDVSSLKAWENGRVFDNQGPNGANAWFERRVVEPPRLVEVGAHPPAPVLEERRRVARDDALVRHRRRRLLGGRLDGRAAARHLLRAAHLQPQVVPGPGRAAAVAVVAAAVPEHVELPVVAALPAAVVLVGRA